MRMGENGMKPRDILSKLVSPPVASGVGIVVGIIMAVSNLRPLFFEKITAPNTTIKVFDSSVIPQVPVAAADIKITGKQALERRTGLDGTATLYLEPGEHKLEVEAEGYLPYTDTFIHTIGDFSVPLRKDNLTPVDFMNSSTWTNWGGITCSRPAKFGDGSIIFDGKIDTTAGYFGYLRAREFRGKTLVMYIDNIENSSFFNGRLFKMTINQNDRLLQPNNITELVEGEYIPVKHPIPAKKQRVEYTLPDDFDGKLGFVFYKAGLSALRVSINIRDY
jgi:hypothetical protein